jgi:carbohydrate kinase (thermoresistant glucokinase family)
MTNTHVVVMGVAGCGKSSIAQALSDRLGWPLAEGDDFHPLSNVEKMSSGIPLTDDDRWPWLGSIARWMATQAESRRSSIVTCSALRRSYRDVLRQAPGRVVFVHLTGDAGLIATRLHERQGHFMPPTLLPSQFATLEPLEADELGFVIANTAPVDDIVNAVLDQLAGLVTHLSPSPLEV